MLLETKKDFYKDKRVDPSRRHNDYNIHAPNNRTLKYIKQNLTEIKEEVDNLSIIIGDINTPLSMNRTTRQKINNRTLELHCNSSRSNRYIQNTSPKNSKYTFFSSALGTFSRIQISETLK